MYLEVSNCCFPVLYNILNGDNVHRIGVFKFVIQKCLK